MMHGGRAGAKVSAVEPKNLTQSREVAKFRRIALSFLGVSAALRDISSG